MYGAARMGSKSSTPITFGIDGHEATPQWGICNLGKSKGI